jgi:large subunit ribosomal protein L15
MEMNDLKPAEGAIKSRTRVGRGIGSKGKTCGRGHKGQKSRGCLGMVGFEGGQMPLQRRLPKFGFTSVVSKFKQSIPTLMLNKIGKDDHGCVDIAALKKYGLIRQSTKYVKVFLQGEVKSKLKLAGIPVSKGAKELIEKAGGEVA